MRSMTTERHVGPRLPTFIGLLITMCVFILGAAVPAQATQAGDPYGSTSTTAPEQPEASCSITTAFGAQGGVISGTLFDVETGATAEFYLDGFFLGEIDVPASPQTFRAAPVAATVDVDFSFRIPVDIPPGEYTPVVIGATFSCECALPGGADAFGVLAAATDTGDGGDGGLAFTGFDLLQLVILGIALVLAGYVVVRSRRRVG